MRKRRNAPIEKKKKKREREKCWVPLRRLVSFERKQIFRVLSDRTSRDGFNPGWIVRGKLEGNLEKLVSILLHLLLSFPSLPVVQKTCDVNF